MKNEHCRWPKGTRIVLTKEAQITFPRPPFTGTVTGAGRESGLVRVLQDGRKLPGSWAINFWELLR